MQNRHYNLQTIIDFGTQNRLIELTEDEKQQPTIIFNKLITTLLYEASRHGWVSPQCNMIREHILMMKPDIQGKNKSDYETYILGEELKNKTFYGSYLSDDSDSEEERQYRQKDPLERKKISKHAEKYYERAQLSNITYAKKTRIHQRGELKANGKPASTLFEFDIRQAITWGKKIDKDKAIDDLNSLNDLLSQNKNIEEAVAELTKLAAERGEVFTPFYIAEYRGITHLTSKWNKPSRTAHRKDNTEIGARQYSLSIYKAAGVNLFRDYTTAKQTILNNKNLIENSAEVLKEILLTFREPRPYAYNNYSFSCFSYLLQNLYTEDYDGFHQLIKSDKTLATLLYNDGNPFISMGDTPYHPLKYAYGIKPYAGHEHERLRPRWQSNGRAERPYSGVVYTSLHPITDFTVDGPLHLVSLNRNAEIKLKNELVIIAERESCFPSYLPENRVIHKHIAKYPSFKTENKQINFHKYGLNPELYDKFRDGLLSTHPHTIDHKNMKQLLGEALCSYQETRLIDIARKEAERRKGVLIYRDAFGKFSLKPPIDSINRNTSEMTTEVKAPIKAKQWKRAKIAGQNGRTGQLADEASINAFKDELPETDGHYESATIMTKANHGMSLPTSLLLNAIKNKRYLALKKFLTIPMFIEAINVTFNSETLIGASLLHIAVAENDEQAIKILLETPQCNPHIIAEELPHDKNAGDNSVKFYEKITPSHYAVLRSKNTAAKTLMQHTSVDMTKTCDYINDKHLLLSSNCIFAFLKESKNDEDCIRMAWHQQRFHNIKRIRNNSHLHLAVECGNHAIIPDLLAHQSQSLALQNTLEQTAIELALIKDDFTSANLIESVKLSEDKLTTQLQGLSIADQPEESKNMSHFHP